MRAKWTAENFLDNPVLFNDVRGMLGYTGSYNGMPVSVQVTGMDIPSALICYHELINDYVYKNLSRVSAAGQGLSNMKSRAEAIEGKLLIDRHDGFNIRLIIPML